MNDWITTEDASKLTGYRMEYVRQLAREKKVDSKKFGHAVMISRDSIMKHKEEQKEKVSK